MDDPKRPGRGPQQPWPQSPRYSYQSGIQQQRKDTSVSKLTQSVGKRIGGALRAEQARQQKRRDSRPK